MERITSAVVRLALVAVAAPSAGCREVAAEPAPAPAAHAGLVAPNPLLSRGRRVTGWSPRPFARPWSVNDGDPRTAWGAGKPTADRPAWVAIDVGRGPSRVLLTWSAAGSFNYDETDYGSPGAYRIETSADSTDGADGA